MSQSTVDCGGSRGGRGAATRRLGDARGCRSLPLTVEGAEEDVGLPPGGSGMPGEVAVCRYRRDSPGDRHRGGRETASVGSGTSGIGGGSPPDLSTLEEALPDLKRSRLQGPRALFYR
ncbi:hypothetical protein MLD38_006719 [Melastoma candidum]|uniref:Uncharacterized protein n=1 Tax=Melastoma candidum TaxID=119954 RepID=A0ACB9RRT1_9MYRT|nr:hypothetical protein MLD38_006719 [Melastoma candidum]